MFKIYWRLFKKNIKKSLLGEKEYSIDACITVVFVTCTHTHIYIYAHIFKIKLKKERKRKLQK